MNNFNLREEAKGIFDDVHSFGLKYVRHKTIYTFFQHFFKPRIDNIILKEATEEDIKDVMWMIKKRIDRLVKHLDVVETISENKLNPELNRKLQELPEFKELMKILK